VGLPLVHHSGGLNCILILVDDDGNVSPELAEPFELLISQELRQAVVSTEEASLADQVELLDRQHWRTTLELALAIADYIEHFYNSARRHSALGYLTPNEFEDLHSPQPEATLS